MIIVTGGAGFIGSCLQAALHARGTRTAVVDWLGSEGKWRNLARHAPDELVDPAALDGFLKTVGHVEAVFHLGAISETTARDGDLVWRTNVELPWTLWQWCARRGVPFVYASSAATYGGADRPEEFSDAPDRLQTLAPLNLYGWSKHVFDMRVMAHLARGGAAPPQWVGLKFFNVYGPNEYHKDKMISVVKIKYDEIAAGRAPRLFRSEVPGLADGAQARDFVWVGDTVDVMLWMLDHPAVSGLYNCGTGVERTYLDLAYAVCDAAGAPRDVTFIDMPESLRGQYQSFTRADLGRLRAVGYDRPFTSLEDGIGRYVREYLAPGTPYL
ncbi:ADP-L-glycero-D-manno-heptose-6-epimerase [Ameyamaea chiangmaiensis NBRC 103196]|uniref:ADP-L-glycero-D-manno-heptose-6-epimerase n=1 Tax=Ameyamaea chiangmaiensis TaxID=442969 RepID=A0A850PG57_9PROT|nr:ADP-glyceromanno-heptose 6-epimerase [Ameyamaea chiangmaiensis]MBS4074976.1 ADP-glyceromanno-heptose 6-epimerase [Ameyamaea chiangmaiensis]NVN41823.1 ADP-glyceromanno-heptose 6-epimerase [Ameyamaea chiangmaiensis]GBQ65963.1 ADP-L-glycero-D-manno-heptose-6-epimerase [Ameyamaea chiangmaiensis NBRC 103196]